MGGKLAKRANRNTFGSSQYTKLLNLIRTGKPGCGWALYGSCTRLGDTRRAPGGTCGQACWERGTRVRPYECCAGH